MSAKTLFLLALLAAPLVHADAIVEACQRDIRQQTIARAQLKLPSMTSVVAGAAIDGGTPAAEYTVQADTAVCIADKIRLVFKSASNYEFYCLMANAKNQSECFRGWLGKQDISYAKQVAQLALTTREVAVRDLEKPGADREKIKLAAVDAWLFQLEHYSLEKNVLYKAGSGPRYAPLRQVEFADYRKVHAKVLRLAEIGLYSLASPEVRAPATAKPVAAKPAVRPDLAPYYKRLAALKSRR